MAICLEPKFSGESILSASLRMSMHRKGDKEKAVIFTDDYFPGILHTASFNPPVLSGVE